MKKKYNRMNKTNAIKAYLRAINKETNYCEVKFVDDSADENMDSVHFEIRLKTDPFYDCAVLNVSKKFEFLNQLLFCKYFGSLPTYNNDHTSFWVFRPEYFGNKRKGTK